MRFSQVLLPVASILSTANAILREDAFHIDYHHALLGIPQAHTTCFHTPQHSSNASLLYTLSDKAVVGAVNPKDGSTLWRQFLSETPVECANNTFLVPGAHGQIFTGYDSTVTAWDALDGRLAWDHMLEKDSVVKGLQTVPTIGGGGDNIVQDVIVLGQSTTGAVTVSRISDGLGQKWEHKDSSISQDTAISIATTAKHIYYISKSSGLLSGGKAKVVVLGIDTGAEVNTYSVATDSQPLSVDRSFSLGSGSDTPFLISGEAPYRSLKFNLLGSNKVSTLPLETGQQTIVSVKAVHGHNGDSPSHFLVHVFTQTTNYAIVFHIDPKTGDVKKAYSTPATSESCNYIASTVGDKLYFARISSSEVDLYRSDSSSKVGSWTTGPDDQASQVYRHPSLEIEHATLEISLRGKNGLAIRCATTSVQGGWTLWRNSEMQWSRPEFLAYITKATWSEDATTLGLAQEIEAEAISDPVTAYVHRVARHAAELRHLPDYISGLFGGFTKPKDGASDVTRKALVGGKLVLAASSRQEIFAIDAMNGGNVKWWTDFSSKSTGQVVDMSVTDNRLTVYLSTGSILVVDITNGAQLDFVDGNGPFNKIVELPGQQAPTVVKISADGTPKVFQDLAPTVPVESSSLVTINLKGEAVGWNVAERVVDMWTLRPESPAKIVNAISRSAHDPVASIGKVLGDRSVLYKFVTPNIALLTALSSTTLTIYLVNAISGAILHTSTHEGVLADFPTPAVLSENWFAYSFTMRDPITSGLSTQLIITELYESAVSNDRGLLSSAANYSSYSADAGAPPHALSTAYAIAEPISVLSVTQTLQGITSRRVLASLFNSNAILSIPLEILNARRPHDRDPTPLEAEEGLTRYSPILDLDPRFILSHAREVAGINRIISAPTLLESTSVVFAFGHDVFGTQVAPSNAFDVLGKEFNKVNLILTVVALYGGVLALRPIVRKKTVERRWA